VKGVKFESLRGDAQPAQGGALNKEPLQYTYDHTPGLTQPVSWRSQPDQHGGSDINSESHRGCLLPSIPTDDDDSLFFLP
jgi:hypothetical protein